MSCLQTSQPSAAHHVFPITNSSYCLCFRCIVTLHCLATNLDFSLGAGSIKWAVSLSFSTGKPLGKVWICLQNQTVFFQSCFCIPKSKNFPYFILYGTTQSSACPPKHLSRCQNIRFQQELCPNGGDSTDSGKTFLD